jgi:ElaA protein
MVVDIAFGANGKSTDIADDMEWRLEAFDRLRPNELYALLALRSAVFVVEQNCVYQDPDGVDPRALHLWCSTPGTDDRTPEALAVARLIPPGVLYPEASIGRVATAEGVRRTGLGRALFQRALDETAQRWTGPVRIMAQSYLTQFYSEFGFSPVGDEFLEDGIPHFYMLKP